MGNLVFFSASINTITYLTVIAIHVEMTLQVPQSKSTTYPPALFPFPFLWDLRGPRLPNACLDCRRSTRLQDVGLRRLQASLQSAENQQSFAGDIVTTRSNSAVALIWLLAVIPGLQERGVFRLKEFRRDSA
jgi:hypothetical protein